MAETESFLKGKNILAVDDEIDVIETIQEILDHSNVDTAQTYETASEKIKTNQYDLAILDIMGVAGTKLLEECVQKNIPAIMLTAHSMNPESLVESIKKGAVSYLPKTHLSVIDSMINELMYAKNQGKPTWKHLFESLGDFFNKRFGNNWKDNNKEFWNKFDKNHYI